MVIQGEIGREIENYTGIAVREKTKPVYSRTCPAKEKIMPDKPG
jgi:hypothetical protein